MSSMYWGMRPPGFGPVNSGFALTSNGGAAIRQDRRQSDKLARWRSSRDYRERSAGQGRERLRRDPNWRLDARARVANGTVRADQAAQVGQRGAAAAAVDLVGVAAGGDQALGGEGRRLRVG